MVGISFFEVFEDDVRFVEWLELDAISITLSRRTSEGGD
jgi:hypothetical protein